MRERSRRHAVAVLASLTLLAASAAQAAPAMPRVSSPADGALLASSTVEIVGTADGSTRTIQILEGATILAATGVAGGNFLAEVTLPDGPHTLAIRPLDANDVAGTDATLTIRIDTTAPAAPVIVTPLEGDLLAHTPIVIEGNAEPAARVSVEELGTGSRFNAVADPSGNWSVEAQLGDGARRLRATATDAAGNLGSPSTERRFTIDTRPPPSPTVTQPPEGARRNVATINVAGIGEPGATITIDEGVQLATTTALGDATWSKLLTFSEGTHQLTVRARDAAGHVSGPVTRRFTIDLTPPPAPEILLPLQHAVVGPANVLVTGRAEPLSAVALHRGGVHIVEVRADDRGNWEAVVQAPAGSNELRARARDVAGNTGAFSPYRLFTVDATPPELTILTESGQTILPGQSPRIVGTAKDTFGVERIDLGFYDLLGRGVGSYRAICAQCPVGTDVQWRNERSPAVGRFVIKVYAVDRVGNRSIEQELVMTVIGVPEV